MGASLTEAASELQAGQVSEVLRVNAQDYLIKLQQRVDGAADFSEVKAAVKAEIRRRNAEESLRDALERLKTDLDVVIAEERL